MTLRSLTFRLRLLAVAGALGAGALFAPTVAFAEGGQSGTSQDVEQEAEGGDQTITQDNISSINQTQVNNNINASPAVVVGDGEASTANRQSNSNDADADVDQDNDAEQDQDFDQGQLVGQFVDGNGEDGCDPCDSGSGGASQDVEQEAEGGDQDASQTNESSVNQNQVNNNYNMSPAVVVGDGEATTWNHQTNSNEADADVDQDNEADQDQDFDQRQGVVQSVSGGDDGCDYCGGNSGSVSQDVEQEAEGGDQDATQTNDSSVNQDQTNNNTNYSPATVSGAAPGMWETKEYCGERAGHDSPSASTHNYQDNRNEADADVDQDNEADQDQDFDQHQVVGQFVDGHEAGDDCYCQPNGLRSHGDSSGVSQDVEQEAEGGDQTVDQGNNSRVGQRQDNTNTNQSPATVTGPAQAGGFWLEDGYGEGGSASTFNRQSNDNDADADVEQDNEADQDQDFDQSQFVVQHVEGNEGGNGCGCDECGCEANRLYHPNGGHSSGVSQDVEQEAEGGDQTVNQGNNSRVGQQQDNTNTNQSPATVDGGRALPPIWAEHGCGCDYGEAASASTHNRQSNDNDADADVDQANDADQDQDFDQSQFVVQHVEGHDGGSGGCGCVPTLRMQPNGGHSSGVSQDVEQEAEGGDQTIDQSNDSTVNQDQTNNNTNNSPATVTGAAQEAWTSNHACDRCAHQDSPSASTHNWQSNENDADADVEQDNDADQDQDFEQHQFVFQDVSSNEDPCDPCAGGPGSVSQDVEQEAEGGDQDATQSNDSGVTQDQSNDNTNQSPAYVQSPSANYTPECGRCGGVEDYGGGGGGAWTWNVQRNENDADADVEQDNDADQDQEFRQRQFVVQATHWYQEVSQR